MTRTLGLAAVDAAFASYLLGRGLPTERRDWARVLIVGLTLAICAVFLAVIGWPHHVDQPPSLPPVLPAAPGTPV